MLSSMHSLNGSSSSTITSPISSPLGSSLSGQVGLGLRKPFYDLVLSGQTSIPWFEVISENFMFFGGKPRQILARARELYPMVFHGVGLNIGSLDPVDKDYLQSLKTMIDEFSPLWVSDHLCWTSWKKENSHDLLPLAYTKDSLKRVLIKIEQVQQYLGQMIYLENPSAYVEFSRADMSEAEFVSEMCRNSGCGLLLDVNNLVVNQYNLGADPYIYLETVRDCPVRQIHLAGHSLRDQVRIDTHDAPVGPEALTLLDRAMQLWPNANPMLEWVDQIPDFSVLAEAVAQLQARFDASAGVEVSNSKIANLEKVLSIQEVKSSNPIPVSSANDELENYHQFWKFLKNPLASTSGLSRSPLLRTDRPTPSMVGLSVYTNAYFLRLKDVIQSIFPTVYWATETVFDPLIQEYFRAHPSYQHTIDFVGSDFPEFILKCEFDFEVERQIISDIASFELNIFNAVVAQDHPLGCVKNHATNFDAAALADDQDIHRELAFGPSLKLLKTGFGVHKIIESVAKEGLASIPEPQACTYIFFRKNHEVCWRIATDFEAEALQIWGQQASLPTVCATLCDSLGEQSQLTPEDVANDVAKKVMKLAIELSDNLFWVSEKRPRSRRDVNLAVDML